MSEHEQLHIGKDAETQDMVKKAEANFPHLDQPEAIQKQADMGPGKEAPTGAGSMTGRAMGAAKEAVSSVTETIKQANPATRDMKEKHC